MKRRNNKPLRAGLLCLLGAVLLTGCGGATEPPTGTTETRPRAYTEGPPETTQAGGETTTDGKKEEVIPKVDIETVKADKKLFVGVTDKNALSYAKRLPVRNSNMCLRRTTAGHPRQGTPTAKPACLR